MGDPRLELDGEHVSARLLPERGTHGGYSLVIEGTTQSHVNPDDPLGTRTYAGLARRRQAHVEHLPKPALEQHADEELGRLLGVVDSEYLTIA